MNMSMVSRATSPWLATTTFTLTLAALSAYLLRNKWRDLTVKIRDLEKALKASIDKNAAERLGRIRAQQALRKALLEQKTNSLEQTTYPMVPIGIVQSCFSTRNGTPRQPLLVPLARACLMFDPVRVPPASLEGLEEYSHIWIVYVFHLNTDIEKLWMEPSRSKVKAKVRVPRLKGGKKGVFATRSPHRPSPIGLTVAKIEAVQGNMILLSGVDLVDGTPILDVKPYLPYCDSIKDAAVPEWVKADSSLAVASVTFSEGFSSTLETCWELVEGSTLYSSPSEIKRLIEQVLSWDIRSPAQRNRPHKSLLKSEFCSEPPDNSVSTRDSEDEETFDPVSEVGASNPIVYHLILEGLDVAYKIDCEGNVLIDSVIPTISSQKSKNRCNYNMWRGKLSN